SPSPHPRPGSGPPVRGRVEPRRRPFDMPQVGVIAYGAWLIGAAEADQVHGQFLWGLVASLLGLIRIFACASGSPRAPKAFSTPPSPTVPVMSGVTSTLPSASMCSVSRNSIGV